MSGADVFTMAPEKVHEAVEVLFGVEAEVDNLTTGIQTDTEGVASVLADAQCAIGEALKTASDFWCVQRTMGFTGLVGNLGEYLAVCAEQAVEIDDFTAHDFATLADHDRYPGRAAENASARPDW
ncbi:hypothetical protein [Glycomyces dulcitolivorans]|jgi:hypothetical protein|uniref:hypothetical protein n=1 Tax=Glycomyces dulcitolivorans TaxID=2200759 RepID=UPI000DD2C14C|nr:hypothetical protein [Glycomyces dulcitolivorans]